MARWPLLAVTAHMTVALRTVTYGSTSVASQQWAGEIHVGAVSSMSRTDPFYTQGASRRHAMQMFANWVCRCRSNLG